MVGGGAAITKVTGVGVWINWGCAVRFSRGFEGCENDVTGSG